VKDSPFTLEYALNGGRHTVTITAKDELPDEVHLRLSEEAFQAERAVAPAAAAQAECTPVGLQNTLHFTEIPFEVVDGVHKAVLTVDLPKDVQLGGEATILSQGGEEVFRTPPGGLLAVISADDRSWVGVLQPQQA
jgi:hypothetical protein